MNGMQSLLSIEVVDQVYFDLISIVLLKSKPNLAAEINYGYLQNTTFVR